MHVRFEAFLDEHRGDLNHGLDGLTEGKHADRW
jgi:hypothetical protein